MKPAALLALAGALIATPAWADTTVIHAGAVVVDAQSQPLGASTITVTDGRIVGVADGHAPAPEGAVVVDLKDRTLAPGMIDLHVHLTGDPGGDFWKATVEPDEWDVVVGAKNARATVLAGFTTVREAGSGPASAFSLRRGTAVFVVAVPVIGERLHDQRAPRPLRIGVKPLDLAKEPGRIFVFAAVQFELGPAIDLFGRKCIQRLFAGGEQPPAAARKHCDKR